MVIIDSAPDLYLLVLHWQEIESLMGPRCMWTPFMEHNYCFPVPRTGDTPYYRISKCVLIHLFLIIASKYA